MGLSPYRLDKRQYRGVFKAGFMSRNGGINFWATDDDPIRRRRRRHKKWFAILLLILLSLTIWFFIESLAAWELF